MKVVNQKKGLLVKHLLVIFFIFSIIGTLKAQFLPIIGEDIELQPSGLNTPSIDVSVSNVQKINDGSGVHHYNAVVDFAFDFGNSIPLDKIKELGFDIKLGSLGSGSFDSWTIPNSEILICNGGILLDATQNINDLNIYHIIVSFPNGITEANTCEGSENGIATLGLFIDGVITGSSSFASSDCYERFNNIKTKIEIINGYVKLRRNTFIPLNEVNYQEEFNVPDCLMPPIENGHSFDINLVISEFTSTNVAVDVYFRYTDGANNSSIINSGLVRVSHNHSNFFNPSLTIMRNSPVNAYLLPQSGILTFDGATITGSASTPIYLGTLTYVLKQPEEPSLSYFYAEEGLFTDQWGFLTSNVEGYHDEEYYDYIVDGEYRIAGISKSEKEYINVSPSPAKNIVIIETNFDLDESLNINVYNAMGKETGPLDYNFNGVGQVQINIQDLSKGIYFIVLTNKSSGLTVKILKE